MIFYLDENLSEHVADALNFLNKGHFSDVQVYSTKTKFGRGAPDEEIIPAIATESAFLITRDFGKKDGVIIPLCQKHNVSVFFIYLQKGLETHWELVRVLINHWEEMIKRAKQDKKPFLYRVRRKGKFERM
jgi:hypothetical protein